ncbi:MAG: sigma-54-dependent Fis family transcriptional regulator [Deltaproteobacteria bacterium]|nr:sigma-54-dependent Fis family transcriptional regulator [Deltaproteobacteria bacterium]MBI3391011.1 sigma-54-dependent Fis family transcriptional regulator [Deltaproteobacteria bacterium]
MPTLLIVEDEAVLARNLAKAFSRQGYEVHHAANVAEATRIASVTPLDIVLLDLRLPDGSGLDVLDALIANDPDQPVVMMTAYGSVADAVRAMQRGARDFVQKPLDLDEIALKVEHALKSTRQRREISYYRERGSAAGTILGESPGAERLRTLITRIARMTAGPGAPAPTVLLLGETGSGKGHVARALHAASGRRDGPFIEVNCTALPENLVEAELFGYERGAFTDAKTARAGLFETAEGGTLFLDEIGHISGALQAKFLKVIEEKVVRRIGANAARRIDVQIIAATNRDLEAATRLGEFREDLYQRLSVAVIRIPPLREREGDALRLARDLLNDACRRYSVPPRALSPEAEAAIARHPWPGNVRELGNTMERVVLFSDNDPVRIEDLGLPDSAPAAGRVTVAPSGEIQIDFPDGGLSLEAVERALLVRALDKAGNQSAAARLLGISRDTLRYRMEKFGLGD